MENDSIDKNKIISLGRIDKRYIIPVFFTICLYFFYFFFERLNSILTAHCIINILFCHSASFVLSFVFFCIKFFRSKNFKKGEKISKISINFLPNFITKIKDKTTKKNYILFGCEIFLTISLSLSYILRIKLFNLILQSNLETIFIFFQMVLTLLFARLIIKYKIEKHNLFGFSLMLIGIIINTLCFLVYKEYFYIKIENFGLIAFFSTLIISYREVLEKYFMQKCYIDSYFIIFISDLFSFIFFLILLNFEKIKFDSKINYIKDNIINLIFSSLFFSFQNILRILLNDKFTPTHRIITDLIVSILLSIKRIIETHIPAYYIPSLTVGFCFMILGILIYNEIIILYFCELYLNVKDIIKKREKSDLMILLKNEQNDKDSNYINKSIEKESLVYSYSYSNTEKFNQ